MGNVGIGKTNLGGILHIFDGNKGKGIMFGRRYGNDIQGSTGISGGDIDNLVLQSYGGNVGIGTTEPDAKLEVSGEAILAPISQPVSPQPGMIYYDQTSHVMRYYKGGSSPGWVDMGGGGGFGGWVDLTSSFSWGSNYGPVTTDGFITLWADGYHGGAGAIGWTDNNSSPTTRVTGEGAGYVDYSHGFIMPVKKGDYWRISRTHTGYGNVEIYVRWIPLGN